MGRFFLNFALSLSLLGMSAVAVAEQPNPLTADSTYKVAGLSLPAEIIVDEWGVPHIYANDHYDVFFTQGFNAARDRLWQIDTWRRRGLGQLSEVFGADYVAQDKAARMFLYRKDMYSEWLAYGNDAKRITESFVAGINAFVKVAQQNPDLMPPEFALLGYAPSIWQPEDVVRIRSNGLWRNVVTEGSGSMEGIRAVLGS
jgi:penicillin amidase